MNEKKIRVRFAPSPTGTLHVGGARTALFNWLFAGATGGTFILRIEDTDQARYEKSAEDAMMADLRWLGLKWDEGPDVGGPHAPYRQSVRLEHYHAHAARLVENGSAYYCFCTSERMDQVRVEQKANKLRPGYDRHCRDIPTEDAARRVAAGEKHVIRLKVPLGGATEFHDFLRGQITYQNEELDDLVLLKTDGFPSYHLANVVDDHLMEISHVLRGDEWIPSTPKHILLYRSFGWEPPVFVHLPVILAEGGGKLSKRKGAASVTDYKNLGYLPEVLLNFLALLGWNPGDERELMSVETLKGAFGIDRINPKSCAFDEKKLEWMNGQYITATPPEILAPLVRPLFEAAGLDIGSRGETYFAGVIKLMQERCKRLPEFPEKAAYFFKDPEEYETKPEKKHFTGNVIERLDALISGIPGLKSFDANSLEELYRQTAETMGLPNAGDLIHPTRLAVSGGAAGPGLFELLALLGRETVLRRLASAVEYLKNRET